MFVIHLHWMLFRWAGAVHAVHVVWGEDVLFLRMREKRLHHMGWIILRREGNDRGHLEDWRVHVRDEMVRSPWRDRT